VTGTAAGKQIKILVVDDSAFMRKALCIMLESDPMIKVIGTARDGEEGVEKARRLKPDLVTMDIEMPRMDGLTALREIMSSNPVPVMMVSSLTTDGASATLDALEMGAVDFIPKQQSFVSLDIVKIKDDLLAKIKDIARRKSILMARHRRVSKAVKPGSGAPRPQPRRATSRPPVDMSVATPAAKRNHNVGIVVVGSSTGGPPALQAVIPRLPRNLPVGLLVVQHMPAMFTKSLAERLDSLSKVNVREAADRDQIEPGQVLIAPGGKQMAIKRIGGRAQVAISDHPVEALYKPCVDNTVLSVADIYGKSTLAVMLTGMGSNGKQGFQAVKGKGGKVIAQNEDSCVVYGMPRAVIEAGLADHVVPIDNVASELLSYF